MKPSHSHPILGPCVLSLLLATGTAFAAQPAASQEVLSLTQGTMHELLFDQGIERIAIADEAVASMALSRAGLNGKAVRVLITAKAAGSTSLMLWVKGEKDARRYAIQVRRREQTLDQAHPSTSAYLKAARSAEAARGKDDLLLNQATVDVKSHTVQVDVKVVEFNKRVLKQAGLNLFSTAPNRHGFSFGVFSPSSLTQATWGPGGELGGESISPLAQAFGLVMNFGKANLGLNLGLLESNGLARVLAEPTLVALSGQSANFLAGGEIPVPVAQGLGSTSIEFKPFGIGLTVSPTVLSNERIVLKVAPEASDLDYTNAVTLSGMSVPAISTRRADTTIELGDGESFVIGGLVSRTTSSNVGKVPGLGDIPVLGAFFKRQNYLQNETELVIVVTPTLVRPLARGTDLQSALPGASEIRDPAVWRGHFIGTNADEALPGFSK
ncbi:MAG: hypothetical protein A2W72_20585 [Burkholderiales bacterium RIFCSPLOWO2_12_67_14]|nr:MAG: hypothetical protein A3I64_21740 [Burkholderiales bacterium RIFCSPLOWO2_02_FULL_67_64]OGB43810.1 MAG: hypothetical protein A2W72_20585 [Burkholderiales bacterium RIFCSPLOWO2_12_67_14]OGB50277.1 MAG: hypothetical protein A3E51_24245 [Burkholderiales bacterium RIFCSPHIGHO2_12_FULL_67_38]OGB87607.1 MAG: hypothetical protein A3G82_20590 [Burkholderiales bacterium RIFCSPLOWO2_12_FULL_67_210]